MLHTTQHSLYYAWTFLKTLEYKDFYYIFPQVSAAPKERLWEWVRVCLCIAGHNDNYLFTVLFKLFLPLKVPCKELKYSNSKYQIKMSNTFLNRRILELNYMLHLYKFQGESVWQETSVISIPVPSLLQSTAKRIFCNGGRVVKWY